jgi:hypothetical protein
MDVDHPVAPRFHEGSIQHPHEPSQTDQLDPLVIKEDLGLRGEGLPGVMGYDSAVYAG